MAKKRITNNLEEKLIEDAKDIVVWLQSKGYRITLSDFFADAVRDRIKKEMTLRKVKRIPKRKRELSRGRLIS